jgi:hypothetical protein
MDIFSFKQFLFEQDERKPPFKASKTDKSRLDHAFNLIKLADDLYDRSDADPKTSHNTHTEFLHSALGHLENAINDHLEHHQSLYEHPKLSQYSSYHTRTMVDHHRFIHGLVALHTSLREQLKSPLMPPVDTILHQDRHTGDYYVHKHGISSGRRRGIIMGVLWDQHNGFLAPKPEEEIKRANREDGFYNSDTEERKAATRDAHFDSSIKLGRFMTDHHDDGWDEHGPHHQEI